MKKRLFAILVSVCMVLSLLPASALAAGNTAGYADTEGHWAEAAIDRWSDYGIVAGTGPSTFDPNGDMTRAEAAQVFVNLLRLTGAAGPERLHRHPRRRLGIPTPWPPAWPTAS